MTPDTGAYYRAAYAVAALLYAAYILSLWVRVRALSRRWRSLAGVR